MVPESVLVQTRFNYLIPLFLIPVAGTFGHYIAPNDPIFKGQDWGIIASFLLAMVAVFLWLFHRFEFKWSPMQSAFFFIALALWLLQTISTQLDQYQFNLTAFLFPLILMLIWLKRPSSAMLNNAFLCMLYGLLLIGLLSLILGQIGVTLNGFYGVDSGVSRIPILGDLFGIDTRWAGPFGSVNYAAAVGGLLLISGFAFKGVNRWLISIGGLLVLMLSQGRTSLVAVLAAAILLAAYSGTVTQSARRIQYRIILVIGPAIGLTIYVLVLDPTFNGRTPIWSNFFELFLSKPITGVGSSGVQEYIDLGLSDPLFVPQNHAHSVYLDVAARYGILALILTLALFAIAFLLAWNQQSSNNGTNLSILIYVFVAGIAETIFSWQYTSIYFLTILFIIATKDLETEHKRPSNSLNNPKGLELRHGD